MNSILVILTAVTNSLWQGLTIAALVWLALRFLPRINAATRYVIWWAALGVMLVLPIAPRLTRTWRTHPQPMPVATIAALKLAAPPLIEEPAIVTVESERVGRWPLLIFAIWALVLLFRLIQIGRSYFYLRGVKRRSAVSVLPIPSIPRHVNLLISREIASPMAAGFLPPAVILPESLLDELPEPEREHVLLHELAHLARYDDWTNLAARMAGAVLALHPVAVWIFRQIEREREMACDDWVVARTGAARPYAASLVRLFELRWARRGQVLAPGIFGRTSRLGGRIETLLRRGRTFSPRASLPRVAASALLLTGFVLAGSLTPRWIAFAHQQSQPKFEVVSIKPSDPDSRMVFIRIAPGGRFSTTDAPARMIITFAYDVRDFQISGGPGWLSSSRWDIAAKPETSIAGGPRAMSEEQRKLFQGQIRAMVQELLADRFQLKIHRETKELPVYTLAVSKSGAKLKRNNGAATPGPNIRMTGPGHVTGQKVPTSFLAQFLSEQLGRTVLDKTGLTGNYDFGLKWTPGPGQGGLLYLPTALPPPPPAGPNGPSIFTAVQEQLGLKLESTKGPVEILVVDHVEKPSEN